METKLTNIVEHFNKAATTLKYPKLKLDHPEVKLSLAGGMSRYPGTITVTNGKLYGDPDNIFFGRILKDGSYQESTYGINYLPCIELAREIKDFLIELDKDPTKVAVTYFKATGNCMFCGRVLLKSESLLVGYGAICAEKWGLPWGDTPSDELELMKL